MVGKRLVGERERRPPSLSRPGAAPFAPAAGVVRPMRLLAEGLPSPWDVVDLVLTIDERHLDKIQVL